MKSLVIFLTLFSFLSAQHARPSRHNTQRQGRERAPLQILEKEEVNRELERRGLRLIDNGDNRKTIMPIENRISQSYEQMTIGSDAAWELNIEGDIGQQYYGSTYSAEDSSGNVFMVANYGDPYQGGNFVVVKYDSQGFKLWENVYDGPISGDDACLEIAVANDQSLLIFAQMQDTDLAFKYGLVKYSAAGNLDTASFFEESDLSYDWPNYQFGPDDCLYLIDRGINASHNSGWFVNKYAIDGNLEASRFFETGYYYGGIIPPPVKFNHLGQLICHLVDYNSQDFLYLLESDLTPIWKRVFDELDYPRNLAIDDKNNMYILADYFYPTMIKVDIYGVTIWKKTFNISPVDVLGINSEQKLFFMPNDYYSEMLYLLNTDGEIIDEKIFPELNSRYGLFYARSDGYFTYGGGYFNSSGELLWQLEDQYTYLIPGNYGIYSSRLAKLTKYNNSGNTHWEKEYNAPLAYSSTCSASFSDKAGFTYMAYSTYVSGDGSYYYMAKIDPDGNLIWRNNFPAYTMKITQVSDGEFRATTNSMESALIFFDSDGKILKAKGSFGDYFSHCRLDEPTESADHYFFVGNYYNSENENATYMGLKLLVTDKEGNIVNKIEKIYINDFEIDRYYEDFWILNTSTDAAGNLSVYAVRSYNAGDDFYRVIEIYKWSPLTGFSVRKTDFDIPGCTSVRFSYDGWGNFIATWIGGCKTTGEPAIRFTKINSEGKIVWESGILLEDSRWRLPVTIPRENGQLLLFKEMGDEDNNFAGTMFYLINRDGTVALKKLISTENYLPDDYSSTYKFIDKDHFLIAKGGVSVQLLLLDVESGNVSILKRETDARGRSMYISSINSDDDGRVFIAGSKWGPVSFSTAAIMRFDTAEMDSLMNVAENRIELWGNYPNPYNGQTLIRYTLPESGEVEIAIYNMLGQLIKRYKNYEEMGKKTFSFANDALASGQYFYTISQKGRRVTGKMIYVK